MIRYTSDRDRHYRVLARDPAQVSMQSTPHLFPNGRLSSAGAEHKVNQATNVTMRHETQPSLNGTGLPGPLYPARVRRCTFFYFFAACMRRTVLGYYQAVPAGLYATNGCHQGGKGMHLAPNGCGCHPAMIQPSPQSRDKCRNSSGPTEVGP
jgi:hypothetical protein